MRPIRSFAIAAFLGAIGGAAPLFYYDGNISAAVWSGVLAGLGIGFTIWLIEKRLLPERLRRMNFLPALFLRTVIELAVIIVFAVIGVYLYPLFTSDIHEPVSEFPRRFQLANGSLWFILSIPVAIIILVNMIRQMSRMLGQNVLVNMITGKYSKPIEESRIFMFLDLDASTTIAERLGNIRYHNLLDDYVFDITKPILASGGEIYQYVGDEVVVTWSDGGKKKALESINCFFLISETMERLAQQYQNNYGFVPGFKAGFHSGTVVTGQIGDVKKEIVFQGDVVNTASRIKETCGSLGAKILISRELLDRLPMENSPYKALRAGSFLLKGKEHEVELFSIMKRDRV